MNKPRTPEELAQNDFSSPLIERELADIDRDLTELEAAASRLLSAGREREERDTDLPSALPTDTDHEVPGPDEHTETLSFARLTRCPGTTRPTWRRQVEFPGGFAGSCRVEQFPSGSVVLLTWIDSRNRTQLNASADDANPAAAFYRARQLGVFPDEFFTALAAPL